MDNKMVGKIIAYTGSHGTGKSSSAIALTDEIRNSRPRAKVGIIIDIEKSCPFGFLDNSTKIITEESQRWIFLSHMQKELDLAAKREIVVSDRTSLDAVAYTWVGGFRDLAFHMLGMVGGHMKIYQEVRFKRIAFNNHLVDDGTMSTDRNVQLEVERVLLDMYRRLGVGVVEC
jgi:hypothetical protein